jgi:hypothetical protein
MPVIGNNVHTLLDGLSDFWTRFWADFDELKAFYHGSELLMAQAYLDMLSSFLNISVVETPLFNKENFKLVTAREDNIIFREGQNPLDDRYVLDLGEAVVKADVLQNKVANPTASLERMEGYDLDADAFELQFYVDPSGDPLREVSTTLVGSVTAYGAVLTQFSVSDDSKPFANAKAGYWLQLANSGSGNNFTYFIERVISDNAVALLGSLTTPDANNGALEGVVLNTEFLPVDGFAQRRTSVLTGGSFDDAIRRAALERDSWFAPLPVGMNVKKGDTLRVLDREALPTVPYDYDIALVRNSKIYLNANDPLEVDASNVDYVILRTPWDTEVEEEQILFAAETIRPPKNNSDGVITTVAGQIRFTSAAAAFTGTDKGRYITLGNGGALTWTADLDSEGRLSWTGGPITNPMARAFTGSRLTVGATTYTIAELINATDCFLVGSEFEPQTGLTITLQGILNDGTYRIGDVISATDVILDLDPCTPDSNNGSLTWNIHDGYRADLQHTRLVKDTFVLRSTVGNMYTGGLRAPIKNVDYCLDLEKGQVIQIGRLAGTWGTNILTRPNVDYEWLKELPAPTVIMDNAIPGNAADSIDAANRIITFDQTNVETALSATGGFSSLFHAGLRLRISSSSDPLNNRDYTIQYVIDTNIVKVLESPNSSVVENFMNGTTDGVYAPTLRGLTGTLDQDDTSVLVTEVAMWAPDVHVDKFHLYNNYGYLLNRFQASSESYRNFIRGVFQLYVLGPALERIEAALNVIAGYPVIRDEGEQLVEYDTSNPNENVVITVRPNADQGEYRFPKTVPIRNDIVSYVPGVSNTITFETVEPLTELFVVTDYVQDPTWWENIVIPPTLMPKESTNRRTTFPTLYENVIGAPDNPKIGDPGLFIGADDEGVVPAYGDAYPAKRRKLANVMMNTWLKYHMFYVRFDSVVNTLVTPEFLNDLRELIIIAKPGWKILYIEPASDFLDVLRITESDLQIQTTVQLLDSMRLGDQGLTLQSSSWAIGDVFRHNAAVLSAPLFVADGISVPPPVVLASNINAKRLKGPVVTPFPQEYVDYDFDYKTGTITPTTVWPAGTYTMEYASVTFTPFASKNPAVGDTDQIIGGNDPKKPFVTREFDVGGIIAVGAAKAFYASMLFSAIHVGQDITFYNTDVAGRHTIRAVTSDGGAILANPGLPVTSGIIWSFPSDEPSDGQLSEEAPGEWHFVSPQGMFRPEHVGRYVRIFNPTNPENAGPHRIDTWVSMAEIVLVNPTPSFVTETTLHWQLQHGPGETDFLERPLEIRVY